MTMILFWLLLPLFFFCIMRRMMRVLVFIIRLTIIIVTPSVGTIRQTRTVTVPTTVPANTININIIIIIIMIAGAIMIAGVSVGLDADGITIAGATIISRSNAFVSLVMMDDIDLVVAVEVKRIR
jgi:hypothetical protein